MSWYPHANGSACKVITKVLCTCNFRVTITTTLLLHVPVQQSSSTWATQGTIPWWACNKLVLQTRSPSLAATFPVNFKLSAQVHTFQPRCSFLARLQSVGEVAVSQDCCTVSTPLQLCLHYVSSAAFCQLSCNLSALAYSVTADDRPSCKTSAQLWSARSFAICHLSCSLSSQSWYVSLAAVCQLNLSAQLQQG